MKTYDLQTRHDEKWKRIRAIVYYKENFAPYFLLLNRNSMGHPGWELIKEGFSSKKGDKQLEDTFSRGIFEEAGIIKKDLANKPKIIDSGLPEDFIVWNGEIQFIQNYLVEIKFPLPHIRISDEHSGYRWCNSEEAVSRLKNRPNDRLLDYMTFQSVFIKSKGLDYL